MVAEVETNAFFIEPQSEVGVELAGCCVIDRASGHLHLGLFYVIPPLRRQHVGRDAMRKLVEFARLATGDDALLVDMPSCNHRGRRFLAGNPLKLMKIASQAIFSFQGAVPVR